MKDDNKILNDFVNKNAEEIKEQLLKEKNLKKIEVVFSFSKMEEE
jgi:hypothetical protein